MGSLIKLAAWALIESGRAGSARAATIALPSAVGSPCPSNRRNHGRKRPAAERLDLIVKIRVSPFVTTTCRFLSVLVLAAGLGVTGRPLRAQAPYLEVRQNVASIALPHLE